MSCCLQSARACRQSSEFHAVPAYMRKRGKNYIVVPLLSCHPFSIFQWCINYFNTFFNLWSHRSFSWRCFHERPPFSRSQSATLFRSLGLACHVVLARPSPSTRLVRQMIRMHHAFDLQQLGGLLVAALGAPVARSGCGGDRGDAGKRWFGCLFFFVKRRDQQELLVLHVGN